MSNTIAQKIADFLKDFLPFKHLTSEELIQVSTSIRVINLEKNNVLFQISDTLHDYFYVVSSGVVNLTVIVDSEETLLNKCYPGHVFGLRPFFAKNNYLMSAKAREESVVFAIPIEVFKPFVAQNSQVLDFLLQSFASNTRNPLDIENRGNLITDNVYTEPHTSEIQYFQSLSYSKFPIKVTKDTSLLETAKLMTENLSDNAIVTYLNYPIGIITDSDFRSKIMTGLFPFDSKINLIMNSPIITVPENVSVAEAQLIMLKHNVSHLCVTQDGTEKSEVKGVISEHDLIVAQANNPGVLLKEIKRSLSPNELRQVREKLTDLIYSSLTKNIPLHHIYNISGELVTTIIKRAIELSILEIGSPPTKFAWFSIGSQGRKEQVTLSDQDSFLIFEDVAANQYRDVKDYFIKLAKKTTSILEKVGYTYCPNSHMSSNLTWCKSLTDWMKQFEFWIKTPDKSTDISSIFFDYEIVYGDLRFEEIINEIVFDSITKKTLLFDYLGNDALKKPAPLNFFKKFTVEEEGEFKGKFDIKTKALMPLIDAARLFSLNFNIKGINNTYSRFKQLAIEDKSHAEIYLSCAEAFLVLSEFRSLEGLKNDNSGQYISIEELSKVDRDKLRNALLPMKEIEELIKDKFQLTHFS